jgi:regulator of replication initiation timing
MSEEKTTLSDRLKDLANKVAVFLGESSKGEIKLEASIKKADGTEVYTDADEFAVGVAVYVMDESGAPVPAPDGEHELEDGSIAIVEEGMLKEMVKKEEEEMSEADKPVTRSEFAEFMNGFIDTLKGTQTQLSAIEQKMNDENAENVKLSEQIESLQTKLSEAEQKLAKTPAARSATAKPTERKVELKSADDVANMSAKDRISYFKNNPDALKHLKSN